MNTGLEVSIFSLLFYVLFLGLIVGLIYLYLKKTKLRVLQLVVLIVGLITGLACVDSFPRHGEMGLSSETFALAIITCTCIVAVVWVEIIFFKSKKTDQDPSGK